MLKIIFTLFIANADWNVSEKKQFYLFCLKHVAEYKGGVMTEPLMADGYCRCLTDILEFNVERYDSNLIIQFSESTKAKIVDRCPKAKSN